MKQMEMVMMWNDKRFHGDKLVAAVHQRHGQTDKLLSDWTSI